MTASTTPDNAAVRAPFLKRLREHETYRALLVDPWTYVSGAVILALLNIVMLAATGKAWGVTTSLTFWGAWIWEMVGGDPHGWAYFTEVKPGFNAAGFDFFKDAGSLTNLGIIFGALLATLLANQFRIKKLKSGKQVVAAILGGLLMGFGARLAFGCNIGALFSGIPSLSLHGWVFMVAIFMGAAIGSKLLVKYFI